MTGRISGAEFDDDDEWMTRLASLSDDDLGALLDGEAPAGMPDLMPLAEVMVALRRVRDAQAAPAMNDDLARAIAARPDVPGRHVSRARRRLAYVAGTAAAFGVIGVATTANALPAPMQHFVADAGDLVGLDVPRPDDDDAEPTPSSNEGSPAGGEKKDGVDSGEPSGTDDPRGRGDSGNGSPPATTPGGATPADPGPPGDKEPATPATPPDQSKGGVDGENNGQSTGTGPGSGAVQRTEQGSANDGGTGNAGDNGQANGRGKP